MKVLTSLVIAVFIFTAGAIIYTGKINPKAVLKHIYHEIIDPRTASFTIDDPENQGVSESQLYSLSESLAEYNRALLVLRGGNIIYEKYSNNFRKASHHGMAAMAKSVIAIPTMLLAINSGHMSLKDKLWKYYPKIENDPLRSKIQIKHLAFHSSGIEDVDFFKAKARLLSGWKQHYYDNPQDRFIYALEKAPILYDPGSRQKYSGVGYYALAYAIGKSIQHTEYGDLASFIKNKLMHPLQIPDTSWDLSYGQNYDINGMKLIAIGSGASITARGAARIGQLILNNGLWGNQRLIDEHYIKEVLSIGMNMDQITSVNHGWTLNIKKQWPSLPEDAIVGVGAGHQVIAVVPSLDLIMVRFGNTLREANETGASSQILEEKLFKPLMKSIIGPSSRQ